MLLVLIGMACQDKAADTSPDLTAEDTSPPVDTSPPEDTGPAPLQPGLQGSMLIKEIGLTGTVDIQKAYALAQDGHFIAYLSNNPDASCERIVRYLLPTDTPEDPSDLLVAGTCDMFMSLPNWDDGFEAEDDRLALAGFSMSCPLGEGEFVLEERDKNDIDYYWSGRWWQGHPEHYILSIAPATSGYTFTMYMDTYDGSLIYEGLKSFTGAGEISGILEIEECANFTELFKLYAR